MHGRQNKRCGQPYFDRLPFASAGPKRYPKAAARSFRSDRRAPVTELAISSASLTARADPDTMAEGHRRRAAIRGRTPIPSAPALSFLRGGPRRSGSPPVREAQQGALQLYVLRGRAPGPAILGTLPGGVCIRRGENSGAPAGRDLFEPGRLRRGRRYRIPIWILFRPPRPRRRAKLLSNRRFLRASLLIRIN